MTVLEIIDHLCSQADAQGATNSRKAYWLARDILENWFPVPQEDVDRVVEFLRRVQEKLARDGREKEFGQITVVLNAILKK